MSIAKQVMWRVYLLWGVRRTLDSLWSKLVVLAAAVWLVSRRVFVAEVLANMPRASWQDVYRFSWNAFTHTEALVQIWSLISLAAAAWLVVDLWRRAKPLALLRPGQI